MPEYRRAYQPGGTFFFTVVTADRARIIATAEAIRILREAFSVTRERWLFTVNAAVILPDHLHTIWTLPEGEANFSIRWAFLKKTFTKAWLAAGGNERATSESKKLDRRRGVWQRRFWEHMIRDELDLERHCDYIHYNPVRHGLVNCPHAWPYSTFKRFVNEGFYAQDWSCTCNDRRVEAPSFDELVDTAIE